MKAVSTLSVLLLLLFSLIISVLIFKTSNSSTKFKQIRNKAEKNHFLAEQKINQVNSWLQNNSKYIVTLFKKNNFSTYFDTSGPIKGNNDILDIPSLIKKSGTNNSVILSNNSEYGTSNFPNGIHLENSSVKNLNASFNNTFPNSDGIDLRLTLISANKTNADYTPFFRVDALTGKNFRLYSIIQGAAISPNVFNTNTGFYGEDYVLLSGNLNCESKTFSFINSNWLKSPTSHNCLINSQGNITLSGTKIRVYGAVKTNTSSAISQETKIMDNNSFGCNGFGCNSNPLNSYTNAWTSDGTCSSFEDLTVFTNTTLDPTDCYNKITVNSGKTLILSDTSKDYHIKTLDFKSNAKILLNPGLGSDNKIISVKINQLIGNQFNTSNFDNLNNAPHQFRLIYTGAYNLQLQGNDDFHAHIYSPYAGIIITDNSTFYGNINAYRIEINNSANLYSDQVPMLAASPSAPIKDFNFGLKRIARVK